MRPPRRPRDRSQHSLRPADAARQHRRAPDERIVAIDIGAGTMDVVLADPALPMENAIQEDVPGALAPHDKDPAAQGTPGSFIGAAGSLRSASETVVPSSVASSVVVMLRAVDSMRSGMPVLV